MHNRSLQIFSFFMACSLCACGAEPPFDNNPSTPSNVTQPPPEATLTTAEIVGGRTYIGPPAIGALKLNGELHCTGTLIGPRLVVTAAHCVYGYAPAKLSFALGPDATAPQETIAVRQVLAHPGYQPDDVQHDLGLVWLVKDATVEPLALLTEFPSTLVGRTLLFVGYGVTNGVRQTGAGRKRAVSIPIVELTPTVFAYRRQGKNTCNGDSGGPALYRTSTGDYLIAGITSYGDADCTTYGVDTRLDVYHRFLTLSAGQAASASATFTAPRLTGCLNESAKGHCEGAKALWCDQGSIHALACDVALDQSCTWRPDQGHYGCD